MVHTALPCRATTTRRGVLLLVVLSLLTLFLLLGTTFLVLSSRARTTARAFVKLSENPVRATEVYEPMLRRAAMQVVRGGTGTSALRHHDLLADRYGGPADRFRVSNPSFVASGQALRFQLLDAAGASTTLADPANRSGRVLTFITGPDGVAGTSTRVVTTLDEVLLPPPPPPDEWVLPMPNAPTNLVYVPRPPRLADAAAIDGAVVLINRRDYAGRGFRTSANPSLCDVSLPNWPLVGSLQPVGQPNEDYDACDAQNLALPGAEGISFHRPAFVEAAAAGALMGSAFTAFPRPTSAADVRSMPPQAVNIRRASLRPFAHDHSPDDQVDFTGRPLRLPPAINDPLATIKAIDSWSDDFDDDRDEDPIDGLDPIFGDVDSDGDGVKDSIWIDLGMPPLRMPDNSLVKPLFAIKCIDLGGRVNVNVHGSPTHLQPKPALDELTRSGILAPNNLPEIRPGLGFSSLDVRLDAVIGTTGLRQVIDRLPQAGSQTDYTHQGIRRALPSLAGRYGFLGSPLAAQADMTGIGWSVRTGVPANWLAGPAQAAGLYRGNPPDFWSRLVVGIDRRGHPRFLPMQGTESLLEGDSPCGLDLTRPNVSDPVANLPGLPQPYSPAELAALLRPYDADNAPLLPSRLLAIDLATGGKLRTTCTTESWDTPAVIGPLPQFLDSLSPQAPYLDHDLVRGLRMNLNRPFGDALDNDGDGIVDEPDEPRNFKALSDTVSPYKPEAVRQRLCRMLDEQLIQVLPKQPGPNEPGLRARQLFAYQLFRLLEAIQSPSVAGGLLPADSQLTWAAAGDLTPEELEELPEHTRKVLAQWAINVVDFMDSDTIMTPFCYEADEGPLGPTVLWGCEAPDVIITETLAIHDRGIADTPTGQTVANGDADWDQVRRPRGSLFVELQAVRGHNPSGLPPELYSNGKLDLGRIPPRRDDDPESPALKAPVWRLATTWVGASQDVFNELAARRFDAWLAPTVATQPADPALDRFLWFTPEGPTADPRDPYGPAPDNTFYQARFPGQVTLPPGGCLVIAPRPTTPFGDETQQLPGDQRTPAKQGITVDPDNHSLVITNLAGQTIASGRPETRTCILEAPVVGRPTEFAGVNISEPPVGYPQGDGFYEPAINGLFPDSHIPADMLELQPGQSLDRGDGEGTYPNKATVFLQRLADPTRPHDPEKMKDGRLNARWNPYVTVDFQPIDLHVMNGSTLAKSSATWYFHTRQRGLATDTAGIPVGSGIPNQADGSPGQFLNSNGVAITANPWHPGRPGEVDHPPGPRHVDAVPEATCNFPYRLNYPSLEEQAADNNHRSRENKPVADQWPMQTLGYTNISFGSRLADGAPSTPFPWVVWNDRPFASEYELLLVPKTAAGRLLTDYRNPSADPPGNRPSPPPTDRIDEYGVFPRAGHLMPFTAINDPDADGANADILSRLFAFVRVESPFSGTTIPLRFPLGTDDEPSLDAFERQYRRPFNRLPTYREPGRVNLNTVPPFTRLSKQPKIPLRNAEPPVPQAQEGEAIWRAMLGLPESGGGLRSAPTWLTAGDQSSVEACWKDVLRIWTDPDPEKSAFAGPQGLFRQTTTDIRVGEAEPKAPREFSLLRTRPATPPPPPPAPPPQRSLFGPAVQANLATNPNPQYAYDERNTWFAYEPLIRAAANTTVRSEVYAIWITMGFFEVEPVSNELKAFQSVAAMPELRFSCYPDGYKLLREHGSDTGDVRRHRSFYLIDRSIPVGYEPGADHNVADTILFESQVD